MSNIPPPLTKDPADQNRTFPPEGWLPHPDAPGQFYKDGEVLYEADLREREGYPQDGDPMAELISKATGVTKELPAEGTFDLVAPLETPEKAGTEARIEIPVAPEWSEEMSANTAQQMDVWRRTTGVGDVTVTMEERILYFKQAWHNREVEFPIKLGPADEKTAITVRTLSNRSHAALYAAVELDRKSGEFGQVNDVGFFDAAFMAARIQHYSLMLQLAETSVDGEVVYPDADALAAMSKADIIAGLRAGVVEWGERLSDPRHTMLTTAVRIFEEKVRLCKEALANGDFSETAG